MKRFRYGKFKFSDYYASWFAIMLLIIFSIMSIFLHLSILFVVFPILYDIIWMLCILCTQCEKFTIEDDVIISWFFKKQHTINLPANIILVFAKADICPPFTMRTVDGNQTHILKDKYSITILQTMPAEAVIETLHQNHRRNYTMSTVKNAFCENNYIFDFVFEQTAFMKLIEGRGCTLIIPESLLGVVFLDFEGVELIIDKGC